ncbi:rhodanese-like domain-containing protein [Trueperella pyogenes]|uniref:rhodanese-like domain-containing protein n=1 Tax=Trueperella pyogenes TaxID=1661 RepID=UPI00345C848A
MKKFGVILALMALLGLTACSGGSSKAAAGFANAVIIDVRTQAEYDAGHLEGARLLDWNSGQFASAVGELDKSGEYVLYCRSGNRAGQARALLEREGFTNVTNLGSLEQAAASTGKSVVKP